MERFRPLNPFMNHTLGGSIDSRKIRYFIAGGWNTLFGVFRQRTFVLPLARPFQCRRDCRYRQCHRHYHGIFNNKIFVFQTKGNWIFEYLRAYVVYGGTAILVIGLLWILVDSLTLPFWIAQGLVIALTVIISYLSHSRFTFRQQVP
jgi:hypothetical protein